MVQQFISKSSTSQHAVIQKSVNMSSEKKPPVLTVELRGAANAPSSIVGNDPNKYCSYFQTNNGEQIIFLANKSDSGDAVEAFMYHSDCDWEEMPVSLLGAGVVLNDFEKSWMKNCYRTAHAYFGIDISEKELTIEKEMQEFVANMPAAMGEFAAKGGKVEDVMKLLAANKPEEMLKLLKGGKQ